MPNARRCGNCRQTGHNTRTCPHIDRGDAHDPPVVERVEVYLDAGRVALVLTAEDEIMDTFDGVLPDLDTDGLPLYYDDPNQLPLALPTLERYREDFGYHFDLFRKQRERIDDLVSNIMRADQNLHQLCAITEDLIKKKPMPKHISDKVFEGQDCIICLSATTIDTFTLSKCGHAYCNTCYNDDRLDRCAECRGHPM
jgi:hypothetical protein